MASLSFSSSRERAKPWFEENGLCSRWLVCTIPVRLKAKDQPLGDVGSGVALTRGGLFDESQKSEFWICKAP